MPLKIQDDMYEAGMQLPKNQQGAFFLAVIRYGFEGVEPTGHPPWLPTFTVIKKRIKLSFARAIAGSKGGIASKQNGQANDEQNASKGEANDCFAPDLPTRVEYENENENENELTPIPPSSFPLQCLAILNDETGASFGELPPKCAVKLSAMAESYTLEDVRKMIRYKRDEWRGTRFAKNLTPNTLLGPDHFEQYIHQSRSSGEESTEYEQYD